MKTLEWLDIYESEILELDLQHRNIIGIINGIYHYFKIQNMQETGLDFKNLLEYLIKEYTIHFKTEEKYLKILCYPEIEEHIEKHNFIKVTLDYYLKRAMNNKAKIDLEEFLEYINNWLFDHLNLEDLKFIKWYKESNKNAYEI